MQKMRKCDIKTLGFRFIHIYIHTRCMHREKQRVTNNPFGGSDLKNIRLFWGNKG